MSPLGVRDDYVDFCEDLRRLCSVDLLQYKRGQMERRVREFARRRDHANLLAYSEALASDRAELDALLDRVTINVSQLWRNPEQWDVIAGTVLPSLRAGRLRAWSAGCSYGAEAYTLAAVAADAGRALHVEGTDIDARMVARAREGCFSADDARSVPPAALNRHFTLDGDVWRASAQLRRSVAFDVGDLLRMRPPRERFDLVLCRNTVIYFTPEVRDALHARLAAALRGGGVLMVGSTERVADAAALGLEGIAPFTYRRTS